MNLSKLLILTMTVFTFTSYADDQIMSYEGLNDEAVLELEMNNNVDEVDPSDVGIEADRNDRRRFLFVCVARNRRGLRFTGASFRLNWARRMALRNCRSSSFIPRTCHVIRCRRGRRDQ